MTNRLTIGAIAACLAGLLSGLIACSDGFGPSALQRPIVFTNFDEAGGKIVRIDPDGGDRRVLTTAPGDEQFPSTSPDGRWIIFKASGSCCPEFTRGDFRMRLDGSAQTLITNVSLSGDGRVAWSPDMTRVAYRNTSGWVAITWLDGRGSEEIARGYGPSWSPDGRRLLFTSGDPYHGGGVHSIAIDGTDSRLLKANAADGAWSPNGKRIAFARTSRDGGIFVADANGDNERRLTTSTTIAITIGLNLLDESPVWSPDGRWIAFQRGYWLCAPDPQHCHPQWDVFIIRADGTSLRNVTNAVGKSIQPTW